MAILDISKYSNHLELFKISSKEIESQILSFKLTFLKTRNQKELSESQENLIV